MNGVAGSGDGGAEEGAIDFATCEVSAFRKCQRHSANDVEDIANIVARTIINFIR